MGVDVARDLFRFYTLHIVPLFTDALVCPSQCSAECRTFSSVNCTVRSEIQCNDQCNGVCSGQTLVQTSQNDKYKYMH